MTEMASRIIDAPTMIPIKPGRHADNSSWTVTVVAIPVWIVRGIAVAVISDPDRKTKSYPD